MKEKIQNDLTAERYHTLSRFPKSGSFLNKEKEWTDHLLNESVIFSYRKTPFSRPELYEKLHFHNYYELVISDTCGAIGYTSDGFEAAVKKGNAILTKPLSPHMFKVPKDAVYDRYVIYFKDPKSISDDPFVTRFLSHLKNKTVFFDEGTESFLPIVERVEQILSNRNDESAYSEAKIEIQRLFLALSKATPSEAPDTATVPPRSIREIKQYIDDNYLSLDRVDRLCSVFFYSREHISRNFRKHYNTPIHEYVLCRKLLFCRSLLENGETVERAAAKSGFSNMSSFIKLFKKYTGCTPSQFKKKSQEFTS